MSIPTALAVVSMVGAFGASSISTARKNGYQFSSKPGFFQKIEKSIRKGTDYLTLRSFAKSVQKIWLKELELIESKPELDKKIAEIDNDIVALTKYEDTSTIKNELWDLGKPKRPKETDMHSLKMKKDMYISYRSKLV